MSILIDDPKNTIEKQSSESVYFPCNGLEIASLIQSKKLHKIVYKNYDVILNKSISWSRVEYQLNDGYFIHNASLEDSGWYKCVFHDLETNKKWATNLVNVKIKTNYAFYMKSKRFWLFMGLGFIFYLGYVCLDLGFNYYYHIFLYENENKK